MFYKFTCITTSTAFDQVTAEGNYHAIDAENDINIWDLNHQLKIPRLSHL